MTLKTVSPSGMLKDIVDNFDWLEGARVGGISQIMAPPGEGETSVEITARSGVVIVPDDGEDTPGPIAMTLYGPIATVDDGKILTILTVAAEGHPLPLLGAEDEEGPTASAGFNGDASKNLATWDGGNGDVAIGDYLQLLAYGGVWYVLGSKNVTLGTAT